MTDQKKPHEINEADLEEVQGAGVANQGGKGLFGGDLGIGEGVVTDEDKDGKKYIDKCSPI